jgi:hypothetical protein
VDGSEKITDLTTPEVQSRYLKTSGSIDTSTLQSPAFPSGELNPYKINVPEDADNAKLCQFYDPNTTTNHGYLNCFFNNGAHPIIELKIESTLDNYNPETKAMTINPTKVTQLITNTLTKLQAADVSSGGTLFPRCYFISFFDDLLSEAINQMNNSAYFQNKLDTTKFQKLLDDGGVGQYITSNTYPNTDPGSKKTSNTIFYIRYNNYINGS